MIYRLSLYVSGESARSYAAIRHIESIAKTHLPNAYELEFVDVLKDPARAERDKILATPTLVREQPGPRKKIMGEFANHLAVIEALEIEVYGPGAQN
ncbi:circadian clock KaiB family protein [Acuticoccus sp. I52.16.1]|uniref:circadian clock KaiB family protein n=1 Tax=Acuticoccus sp. I52.16.1 TaxID=2928472 RepID=UPI001FD26CBA|nr:circadian clock KaiB family protein [Acuticoccus sp. I52.16.1]UOM35907.1 circadian clock KaiB family protein [Acuticoccus sp. I52.16.1]